MNAEPLGVLTLPHPRLLALLGVSLALSADTERLTSLPANMGNVANISEPQATYLEQRIHKLYISIGL